MRAGLLGLAAGGCECTMPRARSTRGVGWHFHASCCTCPCAVHRGWHGPQLPPSPRSSKIPHLIPVSSGAYSQRLTHAPRPPLGRAPWREGAEPGSVGNVMSQRGCLQGPAPRRAVNAGSCSPSLDGLGAVLGA